MWGRPNSVTMIDSSMHTTAEVEFGNCLTMMYFENTSTTIRKSILFQKNISVTNVCHGKRGSSWVVPMIGCDLPYSWHMIHFCISCWMSLVILGQNTMFLALRRHLLALVSLVYILEHFWSHLLWHYDSVPASNES